MSDCYYGKKDKVRSHTASVDLEIDKRMVQSENLHLLNLSHFHSDMEQLVEQFIDDQDLKEYFLVWQEIVYRHGTRLPVGVGYFVPVFISGLVTPSRLVWSVVRVHSPPYAGSSLRLCE